MEVELDVDGVGGWVLFVDDIGVLIGGKFFFLIGVIEFILVVLGGFEVGRFWMKFIILKEDMDEIGGWGKDCEIGEEVGIDFKLLFWGRIMLFFKDVRENGE